MDELTAVVDRGRDRPWRSAGAHRRYVLALAATVVAVPSAGCYTSMPLLGPPNAGVEVAATLNDRGRLALGDSLGVNVDVVEGRVRERTDTSLVLAVTRVHSFTGEVARWTGEPVTLRMSSLRSLQERRLARAQTIGAVVGASAVVIALILSRTLSGGGSGGVGGSPSGPPAGT